MQAKSTTFLTEDEVGELTGILRGRNGKTCFQLQAEQLKRMGIPFWVNARNRPIIAREAIIGRPTTESKPAKKWTLPVL